MKGKVFWLLITVLGIVLVSASCGEPEVTSPYTHYMNEKYGYSLDYPSDWLLDTSAPDFVKVHPVEFETPLYSCCVAIRPWAHTIPIDVCATLHIKHVSQTLEDVTILASQEQSDKWDWLVRYTCTLMGHSLYAEDYFKNAEDFQYLIGLVYESDSMPTELRAILDSFQIIESNEKP